MNHKTKTSILGIFEDEDLLISTLKRIRAMNIEIAEVFTPYPIHEVFKIMKRKTRLKTAALLFAIYGMVVSYGYVYYTAVISYPLTFGGKPFHAIPSFIIICFVTTICSAIFFSVVTFFIRSRLYPGKKANIVDHRITDNAFVILINTRPDMTLGDIKKINSMLIKNGAVEVLEK